MSSNEHEFCVYCNQTATIPVRSSWARMVLTKAQSNQRLNEIDRTVWYRLMRPELLREDYRNLFEQFSEDEETTAFLEQSEQKSDNIPVQMLHSLFSSMLTPFLARTSVNGLMGRGRMFVYSTEQFKRLLSISNEQQPTMESLLDIGAGDGAVTQKMSTFFEKVYATEMSSIMQWRLSSAGYTILSTDDWTDTKFDVISCLNVLDRCEKPLSLVKKMREHLNSTHGQLIIGLVLPFRPYCEYKKDHKPDESICLTGRHAEEQINELISTVFEPLGFYLKKFTRLPYLCEGDMEQSFYFLSDYIFVLGVHHQ